jgi:holo-[acyl-carrier protein] synthase
LSILCGVDIIEIDRIKDSLETIGTAFRDRVFTNNEIEYCENRKVMKFQSYAARFAAKEAVSKAFGTGIGKGINLKDIEIQNDDQGKPYIVFFGKALQMFEKLKAESISLSLSHCQSFAVAYVVIETSLNTGDYEQKVSS